MVLHDHRELESSIVAIINSHVTNERLETQAIWLRYCVGQMLMATNTIYFYPNQRWKMLRSTSNLFT
ncbi:hypothetical protein AB6F62_06005 [Providencia huaxiensis]|uniref:hypothetical protein n=1 Tax=Providencia huaxiensis TaxID=2027290 RepID=UPI0034DD43B1